MNYLGCEFNDYPFAIRNSESTFDQTYSLKISKKNYEIIDIISTEKQMMRVYINVKNPKNNVNAFLYKDSTMKKQIGYTDSDKQAKNMLTVLEA